MHVLFEERKIFGLFQEFYWLENYILHVRYICNKHYICVLSKNINPKFWTENHFPETSFEKQKRAVKTHPFQRFPRQGEAKGFRGKPVYQWDHAALGRLKQPQRAAGQMREITNGNGRCKKQILHLK